MTRPELDTLLSEMMTSLSNLFSQITQIVFEYTEYTPHFSVCPLKSLIFQRFQMVSTLSTLFLYTPYIRAYIYIPP